MILFQLFNHNYIKTSPFFLTDHHKKLNAGHLKTAVFTGFSLMYNTHLCKYMQHVYNQNKITGNNTTNVT